MNQNIVNMIHDFAKTNKVSRVKVENLVNEALNVLKANVKDKSEPKKPGRKPNTINLAIESMAKNFEVFTVNELIEKFNVSRPTIMKAMEDCRKRGVVSPLTTSSAPSKGRRHVVWGISSNVQTIQ